MISLAKMYAEMSESDLRRLAEDVKNLTPEAKTALRAEFERRNLGVGSINWGTDTARPRPRRTATLIGDAAGEYLKMERGSYHAWIHVGIAFALEVALFAFVATGGLHFLFPDSDLTSLGLAAGTAVAVLVYWDRWRCVEAYASEWCTGILNLSILVVPFVAFLYANYRGLRKLRRR
jgi:hypothetical protein